MKKTLIILIALSIIFTAAYWFSPEENAAITVNGYTKSTKDATLHPKDLVSHHQHAGLAVKVNSSQALNDKVTPMASSSETIGESPFARSEAAEKILKASGKLRENLRGEVYLEINNAHITALEEGDTLELDIPFFDMYQDVKIESTKVDSRGNKTINAAFLMNNDIYTTTITINQRAIYGHIETPHGIYSLAGNGQYAWMAEAKDLVHGAIPDQIGGNPHDGSADPQPIVEPEPIKIKNK